MDGDGLDEFLVYADRGSSDIIRGATLNDTSLSWGLDYPERDYYFSTFNNNGTKGKMRIGDVDNDGLPISFWVSHSHHFQPVHKPKHWCFRNIQNLCPVPSGQGCSTSITDANYEYTFQNSDVLGGDLRTGRCEWRWQGRYHF